MSQAFDTYLGLVALGLILYFVFGKPEDTKSIINESAGVGAGFINTLEGRNYGAYGAN